MTCMDGWVDGWVDRMLDGSMDLEGGGAVSSKGRKEPGLLRQGGRHDAGKLICQETAV